MNLTIPRVTSLGGGSGGREVGFRRTDHLPLLPYLCGAERSPQAILDDLRPVSETLPDLSETSILAQAMRGLSPDAFPGAVRLLPDASFSAWQLRYGSVNFETLQALELGSFRLRLYRDHLLGLSILVRNGNRRLLLAKQNLFLMYSRLLEFFILLRKTNPSFKCSAGELHDAYVSFVEGIDRQERYIGRKYFYGILLDLPLTLLLGRDVEVSKSGKVKSVDYSFSTEELLLEEALSSPSFRHLRPIRDEERKRIEEGLPTRDISDSRLHLIETLTQELMKVCGYSSYESSSNLYSGAYRKRFLGFFMDSFM